MYFAKDFIETSEGLIFAVVENGDEQGQVLCFLRYVSTKQGWSKVNTDLANELLREQYPEYIYYSKQRDATLHAVAFDRVKSHYQPRIKLQDLYKIEPIDAVQADLKQLLDLYQQQGINLEHVGVTGSLLIGAQNAQSDIDLVIYNRNTFRQIRSVTRKLIANHRLQSLSISDWQDSYSRRHCEISLDDYIWHEQRKYNKALVNGRKFDLGLLTVTTQSSTAYKKQGRVKVNAIVTGDEQSFDYPAVFQINHPEIAEIVCYTATYVGQAFTGETIEVVGLLEQAVQGQQRLIIGSSREAEGEYLIVV